MNANTELLRSVCQNTRTGLETIRQLAEVAGNDDFRKHLYLQRMEYQGINKVAQQILRRYGNEDKCIHVAAADSGHVAVEAPGDGTGSHVADIMIQGSNRVAAELNRHLNGCADADLEVLSLAKKLLRAEEANIEYMKRYLS